MSKITAIRCDWDGCNAVALEAEAKREGWLTVGGNRRGRYRGDLCTIHVRHLMHAAKSTVLRKAKRK